MLFRSHRVLLPARRLHHCVDGRSGRRTQHLNDDSLLRWGAAFADAKVKKFVAQMKVGYPIAIDGGPAPAWQSYRVKSVPAAFLLDRTGQVVAQWTGRAPAGDELVRAIETALAARGSATD